MVTALGLLRYAGCSGSPEEPWATSPVGRYELVGCTWSGDTIASHIAAGCGTGGTARHDWTSGSVIISEDSTVTRTLVEVLTPMYAPEYRWSDTSAVAGRWTVAGREVTATWSNLDYAASTTFTRVEPDLMRDNSVWNSRLYFWYRRTP
jgi:hypothetical protein